jgi:hypothetical protein
MYKEGKLSSIRNPDGWWINTEVFREEAKHFTKYGYYCPDPWGSPGWFDYWEEQTKRCKEGYSVGGSKVDGDHYFQLNFGPMLKVKVGGDGQQATKVEGFPDFWDGDYNYYWSSHVARHGTTQEHLDGLNLSVRINPNYFGGGYHMIVGKSRRKGYSYKNAAKSANRYTHYRNSTTLLCGFDKKYLYPKGIMTMTTNYLNFLNEHTGWRKSRDKVDRQDHVRASFIETMEGVKIEKGFKSEIIALTFKDNPDAARGKDAQLVVFEEGGSFNNLKKSYLATEPALRAGKYTTGQIIVFGTGGDMDGGTLDFAEMFYNPLAFNLMPFVNIWDDDATNSKCGFFHPVFWNLEGCYDEMGNSDIECALAAEDEERDKIRKNSTGSGVLQERVQEYPKKPAEAFLTVSTNDFPVIELRQQLNKVLANDLFAKQGQPVYLSKIDGRVIAKPDLKNELQPIVHYPHKEKNITGCPVIYEYPISARPPRGLYKIGYDPYRQDQSSGVSLGAIWVYKGNHKFSYSRDAIVAEYIGRPQSFDTFNRIVLLLAELYNAEIMYENEVTAVKTYFQNQKKLGLLASQPDNVINANIKNSRVDRIYGIHMNEKLKDAGEKYIKRWLLTERDVTGEGKMILNLETIYSPGLLEELIKYNRKGNFDRVMAFMMVMFFVEEEGLGKEYTTDEDKNANAKDLMKLSETMFKKNRR